MTYIEGVFRFPDGRPGRYRAERQADGSIWTVDLVTENGECYASVDFPHDLPANARAATDAGAHEVIFELMHTVYGAGREPA